MAAGALLLALYLSIINAATFFAFWIDKSQARQGSYRIAETTLLLLALMGGSPAAIFARHHFHHKTRKQPFSTQLFVIAGLQLLAGVWVLAF
jgi:uncharacterized membrane protein YsdA (DUF1294 family)